MRREEFGNQVGPRLTSLAEALRGPELTKGALDVWFDALQEVPLPSALHVLTDWPKNKTKFPAPSEILELCRVRVSDEIERRAAAERRQAQGPIADPAKVKGTTEVAKREMRKIRALSTLPKLDPKGWAWRLRLREKNRLEGIGDGSYGLDEQTKANWRIALGYRASVALEHTAEPPEWLAKQIEAHEDLRLCDTSDDGQFWTAIKRVTEAHSMAPAAA